MMRFYGTLKLNGHIVGKGWGSNKKQVKFLASRLALQNLAPTLFTQWQAAQNGKLVSCLDSEQSAKSSISDYELVPL